MEKILDIKNLRLSFRTNNGTVKAVRGIDLELHKGKTLAIVGESGSGKSVTARAMLGILAPNSIIDSGEIIYDGKDLLKISEAEFHEYRGNRISMIFQDPMSSLNPIMKIGKQLTEAMLLNGKANQRNAKHEFDEKAKLLKQNMKDASKENGISSDGEINQIFDTFNKFTKTSIDLEKAYESALGYANSAIKEIQYLEHNINKMEAKEKKEQIKEIIEIAHKSYHDYVVVKEKSKLPACLEKLTIYSDQVSTDNNRELIALLKEIIEILKAATALKKPDFFSMGYYVTFNQSADLDINGIDELNEKMRSYMYENYLKRFIEVASQGMRYADQLAYTEKKKVVEALEKAIPVYEKANIERKECEETAKHLIHLVEGSINHMAIHKDNLAYTFKTSLNSAISTYFNGIPHNEKERKRVEKDTKKHEKAVAKGQNIGSVVPAVIVDLELAHNNMIRAVKELKESYEKQLNNHIEDYETLAGEMVKYLSEQASKSVYKVTKEMAKTHAIDLMEEVGIPQPKKRFNQFPFQFSGGMRQRIVIAIALAANPDILICDEPTTALDVTIQSQILELINRLKVERQLSIIFITHDLGVVANMADRIAVMYAGKIVEYGEVDEIFYEPKHPYTWALLSSMPDLDTKEKLEAIPGTPPNMIHPPVGDAFAARNKYAMEIDFEQEPPLFEVSPTHYAATWLLHPNAPKVDPPKIVTDRIARMKALEVASHGE